MARWFQLQVTAELSNDDVARLDFDSKDDAIIEISQEYSKDDGYRIIEYEDYDMEEVLRSGSKAVLRTYKTGGAFAETEYNDYASADTAIDALHESDGYALIDLEQPLGSAPSKIIQARPPLWKDWYVPGGQSSAPGQVVALRVNGWGRTEDDRI